MINTLKDIFLERYESFTNKEKEVASYFINNIKEIPKLNSNEIAVACKVTSSIVVRTAKKLGFSGYLDLKNSIKQISENKKGKIQNTLEQLQTQNDYFNIFINNETKILENLLSTNSTKSLHDIAEILNITGTIYICGYDVSKIIGDYLAFRLSSIGKKILSVMGSKRTLSNYLISMTKNDVLVAIGFPPANKETLISLEYARKRGIKSIVITNDLSCELCKFTNHIILSPRGDESTLNSINAPLTIIHYVILELIKLNKNLDPMIKDIKDIVNSY